MPRIALTKSDMARVIVCALYNLPKLPEAADRRVARLARRKKSLLEQHHKLALTVIDQRT